MFNFFDLKLFHIEQIALTTFLPKSNFITADLTSQEADSF